MYIKLKESKAAPILSRFSFFFFLNIRVLKSHSDRYPITFVWMWLIDGLAKNRIYQHPYRAVSVTDKHLYIYYCTMYVCRIPSIDLYCYYVLTKVDPIVYTLGKFHAYYVYKCIIYVYVSRSSGTGIPQHTFLRQFSSRIFAHRHFPERKWLTELNSNDGIPTFIVLLLGFP